jgi:hypothetical protein
MKQYRLPLVTLLTVLLSCVVWMRNGSHGPSARAAARSAPDPLTTAAAWRHKQCQPSHWHACLLQH